MNGGLSFKISVGFVTRRCSALRYDYTTPVPKDKSKLPLILGLTLGLGLPLLIILIVIVVCCLCRRDGKWDTQRFKNIAGPIINPNYVESKRQPAPPPPEEEAATSYESNNAQTVKSPASTLRSNFYWSPDKPEGTADVIHAYDERPATADNDDNNARDN